MDSTYLFFRISKQLNTIGDKDRDKDLLEKFGTYSTELYGEDQRWLVSPSGSTNAFESSGDSEPSCSDRSPRLPPPPEWPDAPPPTEWLDEPPPMGWPDAPSPSPDALPMESPPPGVAAAMGIGEAEKEMRMKT